MNQFIKKNIEKLKRSEYPGRGIIIGMSPDEKYAVQVYWIMGRSKNSQNRVFKKENNFLKNEVYDTSKVVDKSLIIYYSMKNIKDTHIVTNGDQTETIYKHLQNNDSFEKALNKRSFEPDEPNYTPRISGIINPLKSESKYKLSIIKSLNNNPEVCVRNYFNYSDYIPGIGHCITTYKDNGSPLPSYKGEPIEVPIYDDIAKTIDFYWDVLNENFRISIAAKYINLKSNDFTIEIKNKHQ